MGLSNKFREFLHVSLIDEIYVQLYSPREQDAPATSIHLKIEMLLPPQERILVDDISLSQSFLIKFNGYYVQTDQIFLMQIRDDIYVITVDRVLGADTGSSFIS